MTAHDMWQAYIALHPATADASYDSWAYGDNPDELARLTLAGFKTATSSLYLLYAMEGESLPEKGDYSIVVNSQNEAQCIIRNAAVHIRAFKEVDARHARMEGEGDRSLRYWREVHERFFRRELAVLSLVFTEAIAVVCEEFEVVYP